jgi:hypothetical protein
MMSGNLGIQNAGSIPQYAMGGMGGMNTSGLAGLLGGLFGNSGEPFSDAAHQYQHWGNQAANVQNPFLNAGTGAIGNYQHWLQGMQDPTKFINNTMSHYQESPFAHFQQQQAMRAANNMGSASGLSGSTPLQMQAQQNASNISSGDMNNWLQNVLGINSQYGAGQNNLMQGGQNAANALTGLYGNMGANLGQMAYGQGAARNNDFMSMLTGGLQMLPMFL